MEIHPMWKNYPSLEKELTKTETLIEESIKLSNKKVQVAILKMVHSGGKMLRPAYQILFSQFGPEQNEEKRIALAAAIETLHTATLIHDDIVDEALTRRNLPTIQSQFGKDIAVYAGDYLFVVCFKLLSDYTSSLKSIQLNSRSMEKILSGELGQMDQRYNLNLTISDYIQNVSGKTAELFGLSCFIGAFESGCSDTFSNKCRNIGVSIGIAFQIIDDILDYSQEENTLGKPVLEDVRQGVYSLPLLYALQKQPESFLPILKKKNKMTAEDVSKIYLLVHKYDGVKKSQKLAKKYTEKALKEIADLPDNELNSAKTIYDITETILLRKN